MYPPWPLGVATGYEPDANLTAKLKTFHSNMLAARARSMGMVADAWPLMAAPRGKKWVGCGLWIWLTG